MKYATMTSYFDKASNKTRKKIFSWAPTRCDIIISHKL